MVLRKLIKERPRIRLRVPRTVTPGKPFLAEVSLDCKRGVEIEWLDVLVVGTDGWLKGEARGSREVCRLGVRACGRRKLPAGRDSLRVQCTVPAGSPPSYKGAAAYVRYRLEVHASIDWWPDARAHFEVVVAAPDTTEPEAGQPRIYATNVTGPEGTEPHIECSVASDVVAPSGEITGSITLYNVAHNSYCGVVLTLIGRETLFHGNRSRAGHSDSRFQSRIAFQPERDGEIHQFRMRVPDGVTPARFTRMWKLDWLFEVHAAGRKDAVLRFPIKLLPRVLDAADTPRLAPPTVGQQRVATLWQNVAGRHGLEFSGTRMKGKREDLEILFDRDHRGDEGVFLTATFSHPSLGLSLEGGPRKGLGRKLLSKGIDLGKGAFAEQTFFDGREPTQTKVFLDRISSQLKSFELRHADDEGFEICREGSGHSEEGLDHFVTDVLSLANVWVDARREIPAPLSMGKALDSWTELARRLDARLSRGDMVVRGKLDGLPVVIATEWGERGEPLVTRLVLQVDGSIDEDQRFVIEDEGGFVSGGVDELSGEARALLDAIAKEAKSLAAAEAEIELILDAPQMDAGRLLARLRQLAALAALLRANQGPYR